MLSYIKTHHNKNPFFLVLFIHTLFLALILFAYLCCNGELEKEVKSQEVITAATTLSKSFYDAGLAIGAYSLTKNEMFAERFQKLSQQIPLSVETIRTLIDKQPVSKTDFADIEQIVQQGLIQLNNAKTILDKNQISPFSGNNTEVRSLYKQIKLTADHLQSKLDQLSEVEQRILQNSPQHRMTLQALLTLSLVFYASYNLSIQYRLTKIVSAFTHQKSSE